MWQMNDAGQNRLSTSYVVRPDKMDISILKRHDVYGPTLEFLVAFYGVTVNGV